MTVDYYRATFVKQWKAMFLCFLTVVVGVFLISKSMTPIYQVSAIMQVTSHLSTGQTNVADAQNTDRLVQTEAQLAVSEAILREVASHFQGMTLEQLMRRTLATPKSGTQLFEITVQDTSLARAAALANDIAQTLLKQQSTLNSQASSQAQVQLRQDLADTQQQIDTLLGQISEQQSQHKKSSQLQSLQTQLSGWQQHYNQLQEALAQLELMDAQNGHALQIVQLARPEGLLVRPNLALNLLASLPVALSLSILLALALELGNIYVRTPEALSQLLQWPILALVWRVRRAGGAVERHELVHLPEQEALNVEAYRSLRTNLTFSCIDRSVRTLMVTSATAGEGKSVIAANLAISLARVGKNTLLIDADLRQPVQHELFSIDADKMGLSDAILTASTPEANSRRVRAQFLTPLSQGNTLGLPRAPRFSIDSFVHDSGIANLRIMPAGTLPPNPLELLESRAIQRLFIALEQSDADVIIFDMPPFLQLPDASILSGRVDGTLLVVDASRARRGELRQLKVALMQAGAHVLGCVMNKMRPGSYETSYAYANLQEEPLEEPAMSPPGPAIESVAIARLQMLSAGREIARATLAGSRRSMHRRSKR